MVSPLRCQSAIYPFVQDLRMSILQCLSSRVALFTLGRPFSVPRFWKENRVGNLTIQHALSLIFFIFIYGSYASSLFSVPIWRACHKGSLDDISDNTWPVSETAEEDRKNQVCKRTLESVASYTKLKRKSHVSMLHYCLQSILFSPISFEVPIP